MSADTEILAAIAHATVAREGGMSEACFLATGVNFLCVKRTEN